MKNFVSQIRTVERLIGEQPIIALYIEEDHGDDYTLVRSVTEESIRYLKNYLNITPFIYTRTSFWDTHVAEMPNIVKECPLWMARWRTSPPLAYELPTGWSSWVI